MDECAPGGYPAPAGYEQPPSGWTCVRPEGTHPLPATIAAVSYACAWVHIEKPIFLVLHLKIKLFPMFSITIDLVGKYRTQATARRRSRERTLSWTNWLVQ